MEAAKPALDDLRSRHGHRAVRLATPQPDAGRNPPGADTDGHAHCARQARLRPPVVALYDLATGNQRWVSESLFQQSGPKRGGLGGLMQGLVRMASEVTTLEVLQAGPEIIVVNTLTNLRGSMRTPRHALVRDAARRAPAIPRDTCGSSRPSTSPIASTSASTIVSWPTSLPTGSRCWAKPAEIQGWVHDIVQHPAGIIILPESPPRTRRPGNVRIVNGVVQTGLNVARYADGTTIAEKPLRMRGTVREAIITGGIRGARRRRRVAHVRECARRRHATVRLQKDVKIKGQLAYAEADAGRLLYVVPLRRGHDGESTSSISHAANRNTRTRSRAPSLRPCCMLWTGARCTSLPAAITSCTRSIARTALIRRAQSRNQAARKRGCDDAGDPPAGIALFASSKLRTARTRRQIKQQAYYPAPQAPWPVAGALPHQFHTRGLYGAASSVVASDALKRFDANAAACGESSLQLLPPLGYRLCGDLARDGSHLSVDVRELFGEWRHHTPSRGAVTDRLRMELMR